MSGESIRAMFHQAFAEVAAEMGVLDAIPRDKASEFSTRAAARFQALLEGGVAGGRLMRPEADDAALWHRAAVAAIRSDIRPLMLSGLGATVERITSAKRPGDILREYRAHLEANPEHVRKMVDEQAAIERFERLLLIRASGGEESGR